MLSRLVKNRDVFYYYLLFGLKGLALYLVLYTLNATVSFLDVSKFVYFYSFFLILVPLFSMGVGSFLLRYSYSKNRQFQAISLFSVILFFECLLSVALFLINIDYGLVSLWATIKSAFMAYEAYLISRKKYKLVSFSYLYQFLMLVMISGTVVLGYVTSFYTLVLALIVTEMIALPLIVKSTYFKYLTVILRSKLVKNRFFKYLFPVVGISFLVSLYINMDKVLIGHVVNVSVLDSYGYLFIFIFSVHRFITTPFVMRYSSSYYQGSNNKIPKSIIIKGLAAIVSFVFFIGIFFYFFQKSKFDLNQILSFLFFVCALFIMNLQILYFKKKHLMKLLLKIYVVLVLFSFVTLLSYLSYFGFQGVELVLVLNSLFALWLFSNYSQSFDIRFIYIFCLISILFYFMVAL